MTPFSSQAVLAAIARLKAAEAAASQAEMSYLVAEGNLVIATETGVGNFIAIADRGVVEATWAVLNAGTELQCAGEALEAL